VHARGWLELIEPDSGMVRARMRMPAPRKPLFARELPDGPLRNALVAVTDVRALLPLVRIRGRERPLDVLDGQQKTVVRMVLAEPSAGESWLPRAIVRRVRGYDGELALVRQTLEREFGFRAAAEPLVDEAARAAGVAPAGVSPKIEVALEYEQRAAAAAAAVLERLLGVMQANLAGTIADVDSEFLHDFRVSVRRTRSVQRELRRVFPPAELERFRAEFRWLQQVTGDSRDLDVYVLDFEEFRGLVPEPMRAGLDPLLEVLGERRRRAHRAMNRALRSPRTSSLLEDWSAFLGSLSGVDEAIDAARPISEVAGARIRAVYRTMRRMGGAIDAASPAEDYHELRKKGKELRYLLELFGAPLFPGEVVRPMVKTLKALQDMLGRHQDREIQIATLRSLAGSVAGRARGTEALLAMGALVQRLGEDELAARASFAERFEAFAGEEQRALVKDTFA
jgi:CHAD domain-containing protein